MCVCLSFANPEGSGGWLEEPPTRSQSGLTNSPLHRGTKNNKQRGVGMINSAKQVKQNIKDPQSSMHLILDKKIKIFLSRKRIRAYSKSLGVRKGKAARALLSRSRQGD